MVGRKSTILPMGPTSLSKCTFKELCFCLFIIIIIIIIIFLFLFLFFVSATSIA